MYGYDYYRDRVSKLKAKVLEALAATQTGSDDFLSSYEKMAKEEAKMSQLAQDAGLRFEPVFSKHAKGNRGKAEETKKAAQQLAAAF